MTVVRPININLRKNYTVNGIYLHFFYHIKNLATVDLLVILSRIQYLFVFKILNRNLFARKVLSFNSYKYSWVIKKSTNII